MTLSHWVSRRLQQIVVALTKAIFCLNKAPQGSNDAETLCRGIARERLVLNNSASGLASAYSDICDNDIVAI